MQKTMRDPSAYLASLPDGVRGDMETLDAAIAGVMTGHSRVLWEGFFWGGSEQTIIGYGDYVSTQSKGKQVEWFIVGLALQKHSISVYVNAVEDGQYVAEKYKSDLGKAKVGKSSVSFRKLDDVDLDTLLRIVAIARDQDTTPAGPS